VLDAEEEMRIAGEQAAGEPLPQAENAVTGVYTDVSQRPRWTRLAQPDPRLA
jgi:hypothetical protein